MADVKYYPLAGFNVNTQVDTTLRSDVLAENVNYRLKSIILKLVTDANVAARVVEIQIYSNRALLTFRAIFGASQAASTSYDYHAQVGVNENNFTPGTAPSGIGLMIVPLPDFILTGPISIKTATANMQAGDQFIGGLIVAERCSC